MEGVLASTCATFNFNVIPLLVQTNVIGIIQNIILSIHGNILIKLLELKASCNYSLKKNYHMKILAQFIFCISIII
jgi:hypothetical protein